MFACLHALICVSACLQSLIIGYVTEIHIWIQTVAFFINLPGYYNPKRFLHISEFFFALILLENTSFTYVCFSLFSYLSYILNCIQWVTPCVSSYCIYLLRHKDSLTAHTLLISTAWLTCKVTFISASVVKVAMQRTHH